MKVEGKKSCSREIIIYLSFIPASLFPGWGKRMMREGEKEKRETERKKEEERERKARF